MSSVVLVNAPQLSVGILSATGPDNVQEPVLTLDFPDPLFSDLCNVAAASTCVVHAEMEASSTKAKIRVAIVMSGDNLPTGFQRYILYGEIEQDLSREAFKQFMLHFQQQGQFLIRIGQQNPESQTQRMMSNWCIHLPEFEPDVKGKLKNYLTT